jgi:hypothetical protein
LLRFAEVVFVISEDRDYCSFLRTASTTFFFLSSILSNRLAESLGCFLSSEAHDYSTSFEAFASPAFKTSPGRQNPPR